MKKLAANGCEQMLAKQEQECQSGDMVTGTIAIYNELTGLWLKMSEAFTWKTDIIFHRATVPDRIFMKQATGQRNI